MLLTPEFKTTIRAYVFNLRELIEKNKEINETKRRELLKHLADFETALEKKRLNLLAITAFALTVLGAPGALGSSADIVGKLVGNILRTVAEAKVHDDATRRLPSAAPPLAITGPRPAELKEREFGSAMDDDIPF